MLQFVQLELLPRVEQGVEKEVVMNTGHDTRMAEFKIRNRANVTCVFTQMPNPVRTGQFYFLF